MTNYYEIDFHEVGENKSGDAISLRYGDLELNNEVVHIVDGGYSNDGQTVLDHIQNRYQKTAIDHVVLTHPDGDHAGGLKVILRDAQVGLLWMNRPWLYVDELIPMFEYEYTRDGLIQRLKNDFPHTAELEGIAEEEGIEIKEAFQGQQIGEFTVLTPSKQRYLELVVDSEKTPEPEREAHILGQTYERVVEAINYVRSLWGYENLKGDTDGTSRENEMSIVQYANLCGNRILLTGDAGVEGLEEAYQYAVSVLGLSLPGIDRFQIPHHGGRRNLSTEILDKWLGEKLGGKPLEHELGFSTVVSANRNDDDHPKMDVIRSIWHRGGRVCTTENAVFHYWFQGLPLREDCSPAGLVDYPEESEE